MVCSQLPDLRKGHGWNAAGARALGLRDEMLQMEPMTLAKPAFPAPDHDHGRCAAEAIAHAEAVCAKRSQKFTPIRRQVLQALLSSHRPLGAYEVIDELAKSMQRPAPITVYRALDFLMENGLVHRIESRNAYLACAHDHDETSMVAFLICELCGSVGEIPAAPVARSVNAAARASGFAPKMSVVEISGTCAHCQK
jgi:Fur family transcriptional regulator, zinc uptake regulator